MHADASFCSAASSPPAARLPFVWTTFLEQDRGAISSPADLGLKLGLLAGPGATAGIAGGRGTRRGPPAGRHRRARVYPVILHHGKTGAGRTASPALLRARVGGGVARLKSKRRGRASARRLGPGSLDG